MSATARDTADLRDRAARRQARRGRNELARVEGGTKTLRAFWTKANNDWIFNLSGLLAYNFLMSTFPLLVVLLAAAGLVLGALSPTTLTALKGAINSFLPGGENVVNAVTSQLENSAGILLVIGLVSAAFAGSRLFVTIESCFGVIFRLRGRDPIRQNLMAFGMLLIYVVLIPIVALASVIPSAILRAVGSLGNGGAAAFLTQVLGILIATVSAAILFAAIYIVVPNRPVRLREVWKGTLVAAALLAIYQILFPLYVSRILHPSNYGSVAGFAIVILVFFYYLGFILLLGAEVNSWAAGQRQMAGDISAVLAVQAHGTTRGGAGPTAGRPQEALQSGTGAVATQDTPPALARERRQTEAERQPQSRSTPVREAVIDSKASSGAPVVEAGPPVRLMPLPPMRKRERQALTAVLLAAGAVVVPMVARLFGRSGQGRPTAPA